MPQLYRRLVRRDCSRFNFLINKAKKAMSNPHSTDTVMSASVGPVSAPIDAAFSNSSVTQPVNPPVTQPMSVGVARENRAEFNAQTRTRSSRSVLVVDDETGMCIMAKAILGSVGYLADSAESGEEAIAKYQAGLAAGRAYDIVVMDLALPGGISGVEALGALRELDANVKVIACSGYLEANTREAALRTGFAGV